MRSFTVTALAATGLLGVAAPAQAGSGPAAHRAPVVHGTPVPAHPAFARPQARPGTRQGLPHEAGARPQVRPATPPQTEPRRRIEPGAEPRRPIEPQAEPRRRNEPDAVAPRRVQPQAEPRHPRPEPARPEPARAEPVRAEPLRAAYALNITGQAEHWEVAPGEMEVVRWTLINTGQRRLEHVQLLASVPRGWTVRDGKGCTRSGAYLTCELGALEPGRSAAIVVPMVADRPFGAVPLTAWSRASAGRLTIPGPTTSFRVFVVRHH